MLLTLLRQQGAAGNTLTADKGSYSLSGKVVNLTKAYQLAASVAAFTLIGNPSIASISKVLTADKGTFTLSGKAANTLYNRSVVASKGTFTLSGKAALFNKGISLPASTGIFSLLGKDADITKNSLIQPLQAAKGTFVLRGYPANLIIPIGSFDANVNVQTASTFEVSVDHTPTKEVTIDHTPTKEVTVDDTQLYNVTVTPNFDSYDI